MILTNEDYEGLRQIQIILSRIIKNAVMSELEEVHEQNFDKTICGLKFKTAFSIIQKELKKMPTKIKDLINEQWLADHTRQKNNGIYEIRCSIDKVPFSGGGRTLDIAAENFIKNLSAYYYEKKKAEQMPVVLFNDFAEKWYALVKKPTVKAATFKNYYNLYTTHIQPFFKNKKIADITAMFIQPLFTAMIKQNIPKAAKDVKIILSQIFKAAIGERLIEFNPMDNVKFVKRESKKGTALTYEEERKFYKVLFESPYRLAFLLLLFCGMRRGELHTARIENGFIIVSNGKLRLGQLQTERKIPITPMLEKHVAGISKTELKKATSITPDVLSRAFRKLCPSHHLHELRHTFITRCQECGVPREVVSVWAGHAADKTMTSTVYTHFSDEFMKNEGKKVHYIIE